MLLVKINWQWINFYQTQISFCLVVHWLHLKTIFIFITRHFCNYSLLPLFAQPILGWFLEASSGCSLSVSTMKWVRHPILVMSEIVSLLHNFYITELLWQFLHYRILILQTYFVLFLCYCISVLQNYLFLYYCLYWFYYYWIG